MRRRWGRGRRRPAARAILARRPSREPPESTEQALNHAKPRVGKRRVGAVAGIARHVDDELVIVDSDPRGPRSALDLDVAVKAQEGLERLAGRTLPQRRDQSDEARGVDGQRAETVEER